MKKRRKESCGRIKLNIPESLYRPLVLIKRGDYIMREKIRHFMPHGN